jgi:hypothetical protein
VDTEPIVRLAVSMHSNPGVYALLLGSGVSRAAQIPTGWEIVLDLIKKLAALKGQHPGPDLEAWYVKKYGEEPDYSKIIGQIARTRAERVGLLGRYVEPTDAEEGLRIPTAAHRAIARLVKLGYVRVIITTNFDRLLEQALQAEGVTPDVVYSPSGLDGALPAAHSRCFVFKVHGDYRDTRFRNTTEELSSYPAKYRSLLKRIFDEYGLLICGWSGDWDHALRDAILSTPNRRFTTYWMARGILGDGAQSIVDHRRAEVVQIESAESFFPGLLEKIEALRDLEMPDPTTTAMAVATAKRYLAETRHRIRLHDLVTSEVARVCEGLGEGQYDVHDRNVSAEAVAGRLQRLEALCDRLLGVAAAVAYYGDGEQAHLLTLAVERLAGMRAREGTSFWLQLQHYPALLVQYTAGIVALAAGNYHALAAVLVKPKTVTDTYGNREPALSRINPGDVLLENNLYRLLPISNADRTYTPASDHLWAVLRKLTRLYVDPDQEFTFHFDVFEYIRSLQLLDIKAEDERPWVPGARFMWRYRRRPSTGSPLAQLMVSGLERGNDWDLLTAGFFGGSPERCRNAIARLDEFTATAALSWI